MKTRLSLSWLVLVTLSATSALAEPTAADRETARTLMDEADKKVATKDFAAALESYRAAHALMNVPSTGVEVARTHEALGQLVEARDTCVGVARIPVGDKEPPAFTKSRDACAELAQRVLSKIATLKPVLSGVTPGDRVTVSYDGEAVSADAATAPRKVNPGRHVIAARGAAYDEVSVTLEVAPGAVLDVPLGLKRRPDTAPPGPAAAPVTATNVVPPPAQRASLPTWGWVGFGVGAAGVGVGSVFGLLAFTKTSSVKSNCPGNVCPSSSQQDIDSSKTAGTISTIAFVVGGVGVGVGIVALATGGSKSESSAKVELGVGPGTVRVAGSF